MIVKADEQIEILEPIGETGEKPRRLAPRTKDLNGKVLGLISNHVANADLFIEKLKNLLTRRINFADAIVGTESDLAGKCDVLLSGIGH